MSAKTQILHEGQRFVDSPIYNVMKPKSSPIAAGVAGAFGSRSPKPIKELVGHERTRLRWVKPDGRGGFVPK